jgi:hypothetical protein
MGGVPGGGGLASVHTVLDVRVHAVVSSRLAPQMVQNIHASVMFCVTSIACRLRDRYVMFSRHGDARSAMGVHVVWSCTESSIYADVHVDVPFGQVVHAS